MVPCITNGLKLYDLVNSVTTPRMPACLSLPNDFLRVSKAHLSLLFGYGVYLMKGSRLVHIIVVESMLTWQPMVSSLSFGADSSYAFNRIISLLPLISKPVDVSLLVS